MLMITTILPIIIAGLVPFIFGFLWYHPRIFGGMWVRASGLQPGQATGGRSAAALASIGLLLGFAIAYVMQLELHSVQTLSTAFMRTTILWGGFVVPIVASSFLWERKPFSLYVVTAFYWLFSLEMMAVILFYLR